MHERYDQACMRRLMDLSDEFDDAGKREPKTFSSAALELQSASKEACKERNCLPPSLSANPSSVIS